MRIEEEKAIFGDDYNDLGLVFPREDGNFLSPGQVTNRIAKYMRQAEVQGSVHRLRHLNASVMLSNHVPLSEVSRRLGHADSAVTLRVYSHAMKTDDAAAAGAWDNATADLLTRVRKPAAKSPSVAASAKAKVVGIEAGKKRPRSAQMLSGILSIP